MPITAREANPVLREGTRFAYVSRDRMASAIQDVQREVAEELGLRLFDWYNRNKARAVRGIADAPLPKPYMPDNDTDEPYYTHVGFDQAKRELLLVFKHAEGRRTVEIKGQLKHLFNLANLIRL